VPLWLDELTVLFDAHESDAMPSGEALRDELDGIFNDEAALQAARKQRAAQEWARLLAGDTRAAADHDWTDVAPPE
jgi:hypothetical protein